MRVAIAGKGGTGKTMIAGTLARLIGRRGREVWAIDADSNPNLAVTLGLPRAAGGAIAPVPRTIVSADPTDPAGKRKVLSVPAAAVIEQYACQAPDNVKLLLMGRVDHAGAG